MCDRCKRGRNRGIWYMAAPRGEGWCTACCAAITWATERHWAEDWERDVARHAYTQRVRWHSSRSNPLEQIHGQLVDLTIDPTSYGRKFTDQNLYTGVGPYDTVRDANDDRGCVN